MSNEVAVFGLNLYFSQVSRNLYQLTKGQDKLQFQDGSSIVVLCCLFWCESFGDVSPYVCSYHV